MLIKFYQIYSYILIQIYFIHSHVVEEIEFSLYNCYESFSEPKLFFKLFMHTPSGPDYLIVHLYTNITYLNDTHKHFLKNKIHHFKRIKELCNNSNVTFVANGMYIYDLQIKIQLYFSSLSNYTSYIRYGFENGFEQNEYLLIDINGNFGFSVKIKYIEDELNSNVIDDYAAAEYYLYSLSSHKTHLCVVTDNNHDVIIHPNYARFNPNGYIIGIQVEVEYKKTIVEIYKYEAFECKVKEGYIDMVTTFITDTYYDSLLRFKAIFVKKEKYNRGTLLYSPFNSQDIQRVYFKPGLIFPKEMNVVFLMNQNVKLFRCLGNIIQYRSESKDGIIYNVYGYFLNQVKPKVKQLKKLIYSPYESCIH